MANIRVRRVYVGGGSFRINVVPGLTKVLRAFEKVGMEVMAAGAMAARHEAEYEFALTQEQVPVATGALKSSGRVEGPDLTQKFIMANIVYGGPMGDVPGQIADVDYAVYVHEDLLTPHKVGKAKYVEDVVRAERESGRAVERMAAEIKTRMGWR